MSDFELMPPEMPGVKTQRKTSGGFFKRFFFKDDAGSAEAKRSDSDNGGTIDHSSQAPGSADSPIVVKDKNLDLSLLDSAISVNTTNENAKNTAAISATNDALHADADVPSPSKMDIEEIKRKLGLEEDELPTPVPEQRSDPPITSFVKVDDWTDNPETTGSNANISTTASANIGMNASANTSSIPATESHDLEKNASKSAGKRTSKRAGKSTSENTGKASLGKNDDFTADAGSGIGSAGDQIDSNEPTKNGGINSDWTVVDSEPAPLSPAGTEHHDIIDEHLARIDQAHSEIMKKIDSVSKGEDIPEWHLQEKEVPADQYFFLKNGQPVRSVAELLAALDYIDDETFYHHVNEYRNDFAQWVRDVIHDEELSSSLQNATTKPGMIKELLSHRQAAIKELARGTGQISQSLKKRRQAVESLAGVEDQIAAMKKELLIKARELQGERHRSARLLKDKLDAEIKRRLSGEQAALYKARQELSKAKSAYLLKSKEYDKIIRGASQKEREALTMMSKAIEQSNDSKAQMETIAKQRKELQLVIKEAAAAKSQLGELRLLDASTKKRLSDIDSKMKSVERKEETLRLREKKIAEDLTRIENEKGSLQQKKEEHSKREQAVKRIEEESRKHHEEAEKRISRAIEVERDMKSKIRLETQKLELLRKSIERTLAKATGEKKKVTNAIILRKQLEESLKTVKVEVAQERARLEDEGFSSYMKTNDALTPVGQPEPLRANDEELATKTKHPLYKKVEECRLALERNDLNTAKSLYNQLRDEYAAVKATSEEKNAMYTTIRELYDDIHLAMLN